MILPLSEQGLAFGKFPIVYVEHGGGGVYVTNVIPWIWILIWTI